MNKNEAPKVWEVDKLVRNSFSKKYCLAPKDFLGKCVDNIVRAHSISKSSNLKSIAKNGHVYTMKPSLLSLQNTNGVINLELVGINSASTFTGFCGKHDNEIFKEIDDEIFDGSESKVFLLSYRALCREIFMKISMLDSVEQSIQIDLSNMTSVEKRIRDSTLGGLGIGAKAAIRDLEIIKDEYDTHLIDKDFGDFVFYTVFLDKQLPIMASAALFPSDNFKGEFLQDLTDVDLKASEVVFNSIMTDQGGAFVFFGRDNAISRSFIGAYHDLDDETKVSTFINFLFARCENICVSPEWWEALSDIQRKNLEDKYNSGIKPGEPIDPSPDLIGDARDIDYKIIEIVHNI